MEIAGAGSGGNTMGHTDLTRHSSTLGLQMHKQEQASLAIRKEAVAVLDLLLTATLQMDAIDIEALHYIQVTSCILQLLTI